MSVITRDTRPPHTKRQVKVGFQLKLEKMCGQDSESQSYHLFVRSSDKNYKKFPELNYLNQIYLRVKVL